MSVTCLFQYTGIRIFNDHTCERRIICSTRSVYIFLEKKTPFSPNIIFYYITAPRLNKKYVAQGHQNLAGEFCVVGGEFSDLRCLMNTLEGLLPIFVAPVSSSLTCLWVLTSKNYKVSCHQTTQDRTPSHLPSVDHFSLTSHTAA